MTPTEIKQLLAEVSPLIVVPKGQIDKGNPIVVKFLAMHRELTGKKVGEGTCQNCILDAFFELKSLNEQQLTIITMERKYKLRPNALVAFNNSHYTNANITDEIALEMVTANRNQSRSFLNGDALLAALDGGEKPEKVKKVKGKGGRPPKVSEPASVTEPIEPVADSE